MLLTSDTPLVCQCGRCDRRALASRPNCPRSVSDAPNAEQQFAVGVSDSERKIAR